MIMLVNLTILGLEKEHYVNSGCISYTLQTQKNPIFSVKRDRFFRDVIRS